VTPGFKAECDEAVNVSFNQGLSSLVSPATSAGLSSAANRGLNVALNATQTWQFSAAVSA